MTSVLTGATKQQNVLRNKKNKKTQRFINIIEEMSKRETEIKGRKGVLETASQQQRLSGLCNCSEESVWCSQSDPFDHLKDVT